MTHLDKIIEEVLKDTPLKAYFENKPYKSVDIYEDTKERIRQALTQYAEGVVNQLKGKAHEMDWGGYVEAVLLEDILAILTDNKIYIPKKECINCRLGLCPSDCPDDCDSQRCDKHKFPQELLVKEKKI